jgi:hypothetical protein
LTLTCNNWSFHKITKHFINVFFLQIFSCVSATFCSFFLTKLLLGDLIGNSYYEQLPCTLGFNFSLQLTYRCETLFSRPLFLIVYACLRNISYNLREHLGPFIKWQNTNFIALEKVLDDSQTVEMSFHWGYLCLVLCHCNVRESDYFYKLLHQLWYSLDYKMANVKIWLTLLT